VVPKPKEKEQGRCQAVIGEHQRERPAGDKGEHREGEFVWTTDSHLQLKIGKAAKAGKSGGDG
jgi:hypothetical protein